MVIILFARWWGREEESPGGSGRSEARESQSNGRTGALRYLLSELDVVPSLR